MSKVKASAAIGDSIFNAEELWYDTTRWASFVPGFGHVVSVDADWPRGGSLTWDSRPGGRGRVIEDVVWFSPREGQDVEFEDPEVTGTQRLRFAPGEVSLELEYRLKEGNVLRDLLLVRRRMHRIVRATVRRFAIELESDRELGVR